MKIREMTAEEYWPLVLKHEKKVFTAQNYAAYQHMSAHEKSNFEARKKFIKERVNLLFCAFDSKNRLAGWSAGFQTQPNEFFMMSSAVLPAYRGKGVYTKLAKHVLQKVHELGFQTVTSSHLATNNPVILAKLKLGFQVCGMDISDQMGILVKLVYSFNPLRAEILKYRTGELHPSPRVKKTLKLK